MAKDVTNLANRQTSRVKWHEYNGGEYFVTICTNNRIHYFGEIIDGTIKLTEIGEYLKTQIENTETHYPYANVLLWTIMPNHIHMIVNIDYKKIPYDRSMRDVTPGTDATHGRGTHGRGTPRPYKQTMITKTKKCATSQMNRGGCRFVLVA